MDLRRGSSWLQLFCIYSLITVQLLNGKQLCTLLLPLIQLGYRLGLRKRKYKLKYLSCIKHKF